MHMPSVPIAKLARLTFAVPLLQVVLIKEIKFSAVHVPAHVLVELKTEPYGQAGNAVYLLCDVDKYGSSSVIVWVRKRYRKPVTTGNTVILNCEEANAERVFQVVLIRFRPFFLRRL